MNTETNIKQGVLKQNGPWTAIVEHLAALCQTMPGWESQRTQGALPEGIMIRKGDAYLRLQSYQERCIVAEGVVSANGSLDAGHSPDFAHVVWSPETMSCSLPDRDEDMAYEISLHFESQHACLVLILGGTSPYHTQILFGDTIKQDTWEGGAFVMLLKGGESVIPASASGSGFSKTLSLFRGQSWESDHWDTLGWEQGFVCPLLQWAEECIAPPLVRFPIVKTRGTLSSYWGHLPVMRLALLPATLSLKEVRIITCEELRFFPEYEKEGNRWCLVYPAQQA